MQDWSMIPLHIRCTRRDLIDPTYPAGDDAKWWGMQERTDRSTRLRTGGKPSLTKLQEEVAAYVIEHSPISSRDIAQKFGVTTPRVNSLIIGVAMVYPIWETMRDGLVHYGYLKRRTHEA